MKRSVWLDHILLPVALAALTVCWLTLWVRWGMRAGDFNTALSVQPWVMLVTVLAASLVTRYAVRLVQSNLNLQRAQQIVGLGGLAAVVGVLWLTFGTRFPVAYVLNFTKWGNFISPEAIAFAVAVLLWWRGIRIGRNDDLHDATQREFFGGVMALAFIFVVNKARPMLTSNDSFWPTMIFFAIGLGALALTGLEQERRLQKDSTGSQLSANRHWLVTVGALIGLILVGGLVTAVVAVPESLDTFTALLDGVGVLLIALIWFIVYLLALLLLPLAEMVARALLPILQALAGINNIPRLNLPLPTPEEINAVAERIARTPPFRIIEVVTVLALAGLIFLLAVRRFRLLRDPNAIEEDRESILSRELVWNQLRSLFGHRSKSSEAAAPPFLALAGDDPRTAIRLAYQAMLAWAQKQTGPRPPGETPIAYAYRLARSVPSAHEAVTALTQTYVNARYGGPISAEDVQRAQAAMALLQGIGLE